MNKFTRKYGVKAIAFKNAKVFLQSLREIRKYTNKYIIIELLMLTDYKKRTSEELFTYLFLSGLFDSNFANRAMSQEEVREVRKISE